MNVLQILLIVLPIVILCLICIFVLSLRHLDKKASKYDAIGTVLRWQDSKLPFFGRLIIEYTKKGKPYQTASVLMLKPKTLKTGAKNRWTIYTYHIPNKPSVSKAKRYKCKGDATAPHSPFSTNHKQ